MDATEAAARTVPAQGPHGPRADDSSAFSATSTTPLGSASAPGAAADAGPYSEAWSGAGFAFGAAIGSGDAIHAVPTQREGGSTGFGSVLPPQRELPPSDIDLIQRMREGEDSAYEELFRRHSEAVRRYARSCCRDAHTADDLTAEVFARTLQAVRGGSGPEHAVRAYLLTTVRRVAANWTKSAKREQLVDDFAVFAAEAARGTDVLTDETLDLGADVRAMHEAEQSLAMQAFRSLPERWQAVLWHTTVEEESPSEVAPLFGLTANATAVLASRAREGLKQAYLQAHVSSALTSGGDCAQYADRLGAYARGGLRMRAERGLRKHLEECVKCRLAAGELAHVNAGIPALLPVAVIGWLAAGYSVKAAGIVAGGAVGAAGAGAVAAATGSGTAASGAAAGGAAGGGAAGGGSGGAAGGAALSEGLGAPAKAGLAAVLAVAATAGLVWAFAGQSEPVAKPKAKPPAVQPAAPVNPPAPPTPQPKPSPPRPAPNPPVKAAPQPKPPPKAAPTPAPARPRPKPAQPAPQEPTPTPSSSPSPTPPPQSAPTPKPTPTPKPSPTPPAAPEVYQLNRLQYGAFGDHTGPEVRLGESSWLWQRTGLNIGGQWYGHGATVHARSSVSIDLNRDCSSYDALVGIDDMTLTLGAARFSVYGDGAQLWSSPVIRGGDAAVPVHVSLAGLKTIRLVVEPHTAFDSVALADWAMSRISCR
ncbi:sigma-70 family RNA polymerase sigma factor [Streptomyces sp. CWNU-1]|uniref:Sigma-70 family RNA polymerase sigma factor n=2 Tax=Streptomyces albipurpureus TaxID=2897419 RepID=A0ABT0UQT9_9ACTN|nr:sigma-70 family RNA polymerase sigma factor [Streptomyces sp. CWNU-1]MCM2390903.1 sigma-70 family RNA polymerase sigma factor [Streptomyces sp. CWNU-1]